MNKLLLLPAILLFIFYSYAFYEWLGSGHTLHDVWNTATSDWFVALTLFDLSLFGIVCIVWLVKDMRRRDYPVVKMALIIAACLISGVPVLLTYLAFRKKEAALETYL